MVCDAGALGFVTDNLSGREKTPAAIQWVNACTEGPSWHTRADDRSFIGFTVSPITGEQLRVALRKGVVMVRAFSDGERREDEIDVVTGVIPGEDEREIWLLAHLYEPLTDDNSSGVALALEIARVLNQLFTEGTLPRPHFTLRLVFGMETYGFSAYAEKRGGWLGDQVLCALNLDGLPICRDHRSVILGLSQSCFPSSADSLLEELILLSPVKTRWIFSTQTEGHYGDDRILGDSTVGVPTLWARLTGQRPWHNSEQTMERIDPDAFCKFAALCGTWTAAILATGENGFEERLQIAVRIACGRLQEEQSRISDASCKNTGVGRENIFSDRLERRLEIESARLRDFLRFGATEQEVEAAVAKLEDLCCKLRSTHTAIPTGVAFHNPVWRLAESIVVHRKSRGLPHDLAAAPAGDRPLNLGGFYWGPLVLVLANADGQRSVAELLLRAQWEERTFYSPEQIRKCLGSLQYLEKYGYIDLTCTEALTKPKLVQALRAAGVQEGDLLMVHSGLSPLGVVQGGAETVINALLEVLGPEGTLLMPTFTRSFLCFGKGPARNRNLVPFHPKRGPVLTGAIPDAFRKFSGVIRSPHPTHSIAGVGPLAEACLTGHGALDAPTGPTSPWTKLHELNGKIVFLGADISSCTFLHHLEHMADVDYLEPATCVVDDDTTGRRIVTIPKNFPGPRDFYRAPGEHSKIFRKLTSMGLKIKSAEAGFSKIKILEASRLYHLGMEALREDSKILLCTETAEKK